MNRDGKVLKVVTSKSTETLPVQFAVGFFFSLLKDQLLHHV